MKIKSSYKNGKIYIIKFNNKDNHIYIGSTITNLKHRFSNHKSSHLYKRNSTSNRINSNTIDGIEEHFISYMKSTEYSNMEKINFKHSDIVQNIWEFKKKK